MKLSRIAALVSGTGRGLGKHIVKELGEAGVTRIYAGTRDPASARQYISTGAQIIPVHLDITDTEDVSRVVTRAGDIRLLVNNAGVLPRGGSLIISERDLRSAIEVNLIGTWRMARAFAPVIGANGGGAIVNVLTLLSLYNEPMFAAYCAAKFASWSITQSLRAELSGSGVEVIACFPGGIDTDMLADVPAVKAHPADVARAIVAGIERDEAEIFPDAVSSYHGPILRKVTKLQRP